MCEWHYPGIAISTLAKGDTLIKFCLSNGCGARRGELQETASVERTENYKVVSKPVSALSTHLFRHFCCRICRAVRHRQMDGGQVQTDNANRSVRSAEKTDRQTDRQWHTSYTTFLDKLGRCDKCTINVWTASVAAATKSQSLHQYQQHCHQQHASLASNQHHRLQHHQHNLYITLIIKTVSYTHLTLPTILRV